MKTSRAVLAAALLGLTLGAVSTTASADGYRGGGYRGGGYHGGGYHGGGYYGGGYRGGYYGGPRVTFGFYGGPGWWGPGYWGPGYWGPGYGYGYPYVYGAAPVVVPAEPRVYIESDGTSGTVGQQQWWYWCQSAKGYYPYVSACSEGWQRVPPQPPQGPQ